MSVMTQNRPDVLDRRPHEHPEEVFPGRADRLEVVLQFGEHVRQAAGVFADRDHFHEHQREPVRLRLERVFERVAGFEPIGDPVGDGAERRPAPTSPAGGTP